MMDWAGNFPLLLLNRYCHSWYLSLRLYGRKLFELFGQGLLLALLVCVALVLLLYSSKLAWALFLHTLVGQVYADMSRETTMVLAALFSLSPVDLGIFATLAALGSCLLVGAAFQLLHLIPVLYLSRGLVGRVLCFAVPISGLAALLIQNQYGLPWWPAYVIAVPPTFAMFSFAMRAAGGLLPEIGTLLAPWHRLYLAWELVRQGSVLLGLVAAATFSGLVLLQWTGNHLPPAFRPLLSFTAHGQAQALLDLSHMTLARLAATLCAWAFMICIFCGLLVEVLGLFTLYQRRGPWRKALCWGMPVLFMAVWTSAPLVRFDSWWVAVIFFLVPVVGLLHHCFSFSHIILVNVPGYGRLAGWSATWRGRLVALVRKAIGHGAPAPKKKGSRQ